MQSSHTPQFASHDWRSAHGSRGRILSIVVRALTSSSIHHQTQKFGKPNLCTSKFGNRHHAATFSTNYESLESIITQKSNLIVTYIWNRNNWAWLFEFWLVEIAIIYLFRSLRVDGDNAYPPPNCATFSA